MSFTYRGLKADLERHGVTAEEIEQQLTLMQRQNPRITPVTDRPSKLGDELVLDYAGFCDGVQFAGGTAQNQTLLLGSGQFIPGFEEQLVDKLPGQEVSVLVTFPTQYHAPDLAGKEAEFKCKIHEIRAKSSYELDDTFAKEVGGCETMEQLRTMLGRSMQAYADEKSEMELQEKLMRQAAATLDIMPTEEQINTELDEQMQNLAAQLAQQGMNVQMYCQFLNTTEAELRENVRPNAETSVRIQIAIEQVVTLENLQASQEEIDEAMVLVARQNRMTVEQLKPYVDEKFEAAVVRGVLTSKVMKLIRDAAEVNVI